MGLLETRSLFVRYKSFIFLTGVISAALIAPSLVFYNQWSVESKTSVIHDGKGKDKDKDKDKDKKKKDGKGGFGPVLGSSRIFQGAMFEASGVVSVPGTDGVLFIDDGRADEVLWMRLDQDGNQVGEIKPVKLGVSIEDPEGITFDGTWFYVVGSQSKTKEEEPNALARFIFDPQTQTVKEVESAGRLYQLLTETAPELREYAGKKGKKDSINIEGLAWDPVQGRLLLGLRDPEIDDQALVAPIKLRDPKARLSRENLMLAQPFAIRLALGGDAIRSIEYDAGSNVFQIISGSSEGKKKADFKLWEWDGQSAPREKVALNSRAKPEGITRVSIGGNNFTFIVCDASEYLKLD